MKKIILYGTGKVGRMALEDYGRENVAYFCRTTVKEPVFAGIPVIDVETLGGIHRDYDVVVTPWTDDVRLEINGDLERAGITCYRYYEPQMNPALPSTRLLHISGDFPNLHYEMKVDRSVNGALMRVIQSEYMFKKMFRHFSADFENKSIDIYLFFGDRPAEFYPIAQEYSIRKFFAYSTVYPVEDRVIPVPDYRTVVDDGVYFYEETIEACKKIASEKWNDPRVCWRGSINTLYNRSWLLCMKARFPSYFQFEHTDWSSGGAGEFVPMLEQARHHKYMLDFPGFGWTDRVKVLLHLGRPMFLVDRPYKEWYFDKLEPMKHYIPVKADLSDLVEKYEYMEAHPEVYEDIRKYMKIFGRICYPLQINI